jgi:hypothetical protein
MKLGVYVFGIASIASGVLDLVWGEFEPAHQPLQACRPGATTFPASQSSRTSLPSG